MESVWEYREEVLYPRLFGERRTGIYVLDIEIFTEAFGQATLDPCWLHLGVFEFEPTAERGSWLYVTSGASTPWDSEPSEYDQDDYSWLGVELVMETSEKSPWAISILRRLLAFHVLICHDRFGDAPPLDYGHRIPLGRPIDGSESSELRHVVLAEPTHYPATAQLDSGKFDFLHAVGVTEAERDYAKAHSTEALIDILAAKGGFPVTDPHRTSVL
ncbi:suppressor of fused domain protein [Andreprevotia chitinilytica]|uniref:suppressor of fused domain protein n=1 Tax=Andreprevotia chitinilytica TaxID=396808 RepID=UPI00055223D9|nr:suppressor of fused domain protein [Andreprevotia chitinilytica]